eukprot:Platyproteum_vivax@DN4470_c0_g1_i2.p1
MYGLKRSLRENRVFQYLSIFLLLGLLAYTINFLASESLPVLRGPALCTTAKPCAFWMVADLDQQSSVAGNKLKFKSYLKKGYIIRDPESLEMSLQWGPELPIFSLHNEGGRGMELSELVFWNGKLLGVDDRSGIIFELMYDQSRNALSVAPRHVIAAGDGNIDKGMKLEWSTVKDGSLYVGSFGSEYIDDGKIVHEHYKWVTQISKTGEVHRQNWKAVYEEIRKALGAQYPGYVLHEAVAYSEINKQWFFLPSPAKSRTFFLTTTPHGREERTPL